MKIITTELFIYEIYNDKNQLKATGYTTVKELLLMELII